MNLRSFSMMAAAGAALFGSGLAGAESAKAQQQSSSTAPTQANNSRGDSRPQNAEATRSQNSATAAAEALQKGPATEAPDAAVTEAKRRHIKPADDRLRMANPPPAAKPEKKPAAPANNYVWRPGHWAPAEGEWRWVAGEWALPPTPVSVWIEGKYDEKEQRWTAGYWQPDRLAPTEPGAKPDAPAPY